MYNRLSPVKEVGGPEPEFSLDESEPEHQRDDEIDGDDAAGEPFDGEDPDLRIVGRYPVRERQQRELPCTIPWNAFRF